MAEIRLGATVRPVDRARWRRTALLLAWATIAWNSLEAVIAIASGAEAGSIALVGFGLNSIVEVGSAIVVVWQFSGADAEREQRALKLIAGSFYVFAAYVAAAPEADLNHRGMAPVQARELRRALGIPVADRESDTTSDS